MSQQTPTPRAEWRELRPEEPPVLADLHNHTSKSYDSSNRLGDYEEAFAAGHFQVLGITDHNLISCAQEFQRAAPFPVIVGEEVDTAEGELVGLFLKEKLPLGKSAIQTAREIRSQGGLVYLQHPFYKFLRRPLAHRVIASLLHEGLVDIIETANGGPLMGRANRRAEALAAKRHLIRGAGSDAHHPGDIGRCGVAMRVSLPEELTGAWLLEGLKTGTVVADRRRPSIGSLSARLGYSARMQVLIRTKGVPPKRRRP